jgi:YYY domain-containing protein
MRSASHPAHKLNLACDLLFLLVLLMAAALRATGLDWGEFAHQHPDELFLTSVTADIQPVGSLREYFDTAHSSLNPQNRGHGFFVYGTLPVFLTRYVAEWSGATNIKLIGRELSALADLGTILLLYFIVARVYPRGMALLAAAFSSLAVMQIQQAHFYTADHFVNFFMFLALWFAVLIAERRWQGARIEVPAQAPVTEEEAEAQVRQRLGRLTLAFLRDPITWYSLAFGAALGMAVACKINAAFEAVLLPAALAISYFRADGAGSTRAETGRREAFLRDGWVYLILGGLAALLFFRIFQPYAFDGFLPNSEWIASIRAQRLQVGADLPWNLQWVRRSRLFSFQNLTVWGLGLPLGVLAWAGVLGMGWRILRREWSQHLLLWGWTLAYFTWQSLQFNATMRYQLPVYPLLAMMAAWAVFQILGGPLPPDGPGRKRWLRFLGGLRKTAGLLIAAIVLTLTAAWAVAFHSIYLRPETRIAASYWIYENVPGPINLHIRQADGRLYQQPLPFPGGFVVGAGQPYEVIFVPRQDGLLEEVTLGHALDTGAAGAVTLRLTVLERTAGDQPVASAALTADFAPRADPRGESYVLALDTPVLVQEGQVYILRLEADGGALVFSGAALVNETDYDYGLPFRVGGYDGFGGLYRGDLNLQVYWPDDADKVARLLTCLEQGDYILIPTNHQYGQITRLPERYPLTTYYYRELIGCPADRDIIWCYRVAEPGMFEGRLGYDLVAVFTSYPSLGPWTINDQAAEEAFTFYDHPKVFVFQRRADFDREQVAASLQSVDLSQVVNLTPLQADNYRSTLLPAERLAAQQAGGTWSALFDRQAWYNRFPGLGVVLWYLVVFGVGLLAYPLVRAALPGLSDKGYPLARFAGLLLWAWFSWLAGSAGIPYSKTTIAVCLGLVAGIGALLAYRQRDELREEWRTKKKYFLTIEFLFLLFFLLDLGIRLGNPDLWHPSKGGERPMNFSYFNAILRSTTFPPYDPWFAGGYINYYYFGYVIFGTPVKLLGILPSIAWNFLLPTLYAVLAMGAFSVGWNLVHDGKSGRNEKWWSFLLEPAFLAGFGAAAAMVLLGNLGIVRLFYQGFQRVGAPGGIIGDGDLFQRLFWAVKGFFQVLAGVRLPIGRGDWYWFPSRVIPAPGDVEPITEFPVFTFLYSDMHAHNLSMPVEVLAVAWSLSLLRGRFQRRSPLDLALCFLFGGLVIGALYPINLSDIYTYLPIAFIALTYTIWRYVDVTAIPLLKRLPPWLARLTLAAAGILTLTLLAYLMYQPYRHWYVQAYGRIAWWKGTRTPLSSYLTHWGVFLFVIVSWMAWETREWMAATPLSALRRLKPYVGLILTAVLFLFLFMILQQVSVILPSNYAPWRGISIVWLVLPLAAWAGVLLLRPGLSDSRRAVLFLVGTALMLTLMVEVVVVSGDIGRMNTVFKFYLQAWILLGLSAAAAFAWLLPEISRWTFRWRTFWQLSATLLFTFSGLFLLLGGMDKIQDRMTPTAPHTLDSMTYMATSQYFDYGVMMDLSEDYRAIRWLQDNVQGSPVIVEANIPEYRWGSRYTIYTGLPGVVGWNWHQRQQRALTPEWVTHRVEDVNRFYTTTDATVARAFLVRYNVRYIIVGQLERAVYANGYGIWKFEWFEGRLWREVYRHGQTVIYEVIEDAR